MSAARWWLRLARPYAGWFLLAGGFSIVTLSANMALLAISGWFIASMAAAGFSGAEFNYYTPAAAIRALAIARTGGRYLERLIGHDATLRLLTALRVWFYQQVEPLSMLELQRLRGGDLLARIRSDIDMLDQVYLKLIMPAAVGALCVIGAVLVLTGYSVAVGLLALALLVAAGVLLPAVLQVLGRRPGAAALETSAALKVAVVEAVEGLGELTVFGALPTYRAEVDRLGRRWIEYQSRLSHLTGASAAGLLLLTQLAVIGGAWLLIPAIRQRQLPAVDLVPAVLLIIGCFEAIALMPEAWQALGQMLAATARLRAFESLQPERPEPSDPAPPPTSDTLRFEEVCARYAEDGPWVLDAVTLEIAPGARIAVVGASGAGKTTFLRLLLRLTAHQRGQILWGGRPLQDYRVEDLRARLAVVPQSVYLFHTTVRENLLVGRPEASEEAMVKAARVAGIHDEIVAMPRGYDTIVGEEGMRLSGGQARRVGIARALLRDAPIVLMDEPSEGLDTAAERWLWQSLDRYLQGRTLILVSHRMAWMEHLQRIVVLDRGWVVADGDHRTLLRTSVDYRRLYASAGVQHVFGQAADTRGRTPSSAGSGDGSVNVSNSV